MRVLDVVLSLSALIILLPIILPTIIILKFTGEGEVFYRQIRVGRNNTKFEVLKFATMVKDSPNLGAGTITVKDDPRVLPVGRILRKTKINELPQLINVLVGDMSLIGPRPHAERDLQGVDKQSLALVLSLTPGLSGLGSIIFRDEEKILHANEQPRVFYDNVIAPYKAKLEIWYITNKTFKNYITLIVLTIIVVITNNTKIVYRVFPNLPKPPEELLDYINK